MPHRRSPSTLSPATAEQAHCRSAYRLLSVLRFLVQKRHANTLQLQHCLQASLPDTDPLHSETITKYLNTLRQAGISIPKVSQGRETRYVLEHSPFSLKLTTKLALLCQKLIALCQNQTNLTMAHRTYRVLERITWAMPAQWRTPLRQQLQQAYKADLSLANLPPDTDELIKRSVGLIKQYQPWCDAGQVLRITTWQPLAYGQPTANGQLTLLIEPYDLWCDQWHPYLLAMAQATHEPVTLDILAITAVEALPQRVGHTPRQRLQVVFTLQGKLAANYRPYPGELVERHVDEANQPCLTVTCHVINPLPLQERLMKYGAYCKVLQPQSLKQAIINRAQQQHSLLLAEPST